MALSPGTRIGAYEVVSAIGAGGMGEVYRARDTKLNRDVALKILPEAFTRDGDRIARFRREAQVLAALNHRNIAHIYGFEDSGSTHALVLELVEGPTLAERIEGLRAQGKGLPIDEALPIAKQIAEALEAAHEQGIIHRDLKPANIKVTPDGRVKVLDFGLAKLLETDAVGAAGTATLTNSPTITSPAMMTGIGMLLGTAAYMSPEQAKGRPADKRSDIWAFGCVLYEMLTGRRAFEGDDVSDTLATVLKSDPDWSALPSSTPPAIRTLLARCLQKDRKRRLPDIAVARLDIDDAIASPQASAIALPVRPARRQRVPWVIAALALAAAVGLAAVAVLKRPSASTDVVRFTLSLPDGWTLANAPNAFRISPDGRRLLLMATDSRRRSALWVRSLDTLAIQELTGTEGATSAFWSPDSRFVAFRADGKVRKIDTFGGGPIALCDVADLRGGTWSTRGVIVFASGQGLKKVSESGGTAESITSLGDSPSPSFPMFLPDGRHFLYRTFGGIFAAALDESGVTQIMNDSNAGNVAFAGGRLFFVRGGALMAQQFDPDRLTLSGEASLVADSIQPFMPTRSYAYSVSDGGTLVYQTGAATANTQLVMFDRTGKQLSAIGDPADYGDVSLSHDGKRAAVTLADRSRGTSNIWIVDVTSGARTQFTFDSAENQAPIWSEDGNRIAYGSRRDNRWGIYQKASNGAGAEETVAQFPQGTLTSDPLGWTRDNQSLLFVSGNSTAAALSVLPLAGKRIPIPYLTAGRAGPGQLSPDNRWVVHFSAESGRNQVYVTPYPSRPGQWLVSPEGEGGTQARWRRNDGKEIYFINRSNMLMAADVSADGDAFQVKKVFQLFPIRSSRLRYTYDVTADGQRFVVLTPMTQQDAPHPMTVVLNWPASLGK